MLIEAPGMRSDQGSRWQSQPLHLHLQPAFSLSLLSSLLKRKIKQHTMAEDKMFFFLATLFSASTHVQQSRAGMNGSDLS